jgi:hypothetical protein
VVDVVAVVPELLVAVVPVMLVSVDMAPVPVVSTVVAVPVVSVLIVPVVPVMLVSVEEVVVTVEEVSVVPVSVLVLFSCLQAKPKRPRAATVRKTRIVFFMLFPFCCFVVSGVIWMLVLRLPASPPCSFDKRELGEAALSRDIRGFRKSR